jgi:hypothetical protein
MRARRSPLARSLVAVLGLAGCGGGEPKHEGRTAREWAEGLGRDFDAARAATAALVQMAETDPDPVLRELEAVLLTPLPAAGDSTFFLAVDEAAAAQAGLEPMPLAEAAGAAMGPIRSRVRALGEQASLHARADGRIEVAVATRPTAQVEWLQHVLAMPGAFEMLVVVRPDGSGAPFGGPGPFDDFRRAEVARRAQAVEAKRPYVPSDERYRVVPTHPQAVRPEDFEVVLRPATPRASFTEDALRSVAVSTQDGIPVLRAEIAPERQADLRAFTTEHVGRPLAFVLDDVLLTAPIVREPIESNVQIHMGAGLEANLAPLGAKGLAAVLVGRRLPRPLRPLALEATKPRDPKPDTPVARTFAALGDRSVATLERVRAGDAPAFAKAQAAWALEAIRRMPKRKPAPTPASAPK